MSVQFGRWNFKGQSSAPDYVEKVSSFLARYGPDSSKAYSQRGIDILYRAFHTTKESHCEMQPYISRSGNVITWDGRLDNRTELIRDLAVSATNLSTDVEIVAAAYETWQTHCFAKLIGDWALSVWSPHARSLVLAKDFIGTRYLYYRLDDDEIIWSTILDPLVRFAGITFSLNEEYVAGWMSHVPAAHLTPYVGINAVPASCCVIVSPRKNGAISTVRKYWDFNPDNKIRYRTDAEYEEHFRTVFGKAVQRRLRSDRPVLAELSGGMDSSSIVCMADILIARGAAETPRLDTISWYNEAVPHYNERPYFSKVEEKRGRKGYHIDLGCLRFGVHDVTGIARNALWIRRRTAYWRRRHPITSARAPESDSQNTFRCARASAESLGYEDERIPVTTALGSHPWIFPPYLRGHAQRHAASFLVQSRFCAAQLRRSVPLSFPDETIRSVAQLSKTPQCPGLRTKAGGALCR